MSLHDFMAANSPEPLLTLPATHFCVGRDYLANQLSDPAGEREKTCWSDLLLPKQCQNLGDPGGLYALVNSKKADSDDDLQSFFEKCNTVFKLLALTHHLDKTLDQEKIRKFMEAKDKYKRQQDAFKILHSMDEGETLYQKRFDYDQQSEALQEKFAKEFKNTYLDLTMAER